MKVKVCGMKYADNMVDVAKLQPNYLGFIFWEPSKRFFTGKIPDLPPTIDKIGVFVDATEPYILECVDQFHLNMIQLHGSESPAFCEQLKISLKKLAASKGLPNDHYGIIKAINVNVNFNFDGLADYENSCNYFLFDTKGPLPGGNGTKFDWKILMGYNATIPFFLSGGIGPEELTELEEFLKSPMAQHCHAIDVNSKFEIQPGLKDVLKLQSFIKTIQQEF